MAVDIRMKQELAEMDKEYGGENMYKMLGPTSLSWTSVDSSRMYMFTSHLKQCLTLLNPQVPRLATGMENAIGKENKSAYFKLEGTWEVIAVIDKFRFPKEMIEKDPKIREKQIYTLILYNKKEDKYEIVEKPVAENKTERFGYAYNTEFMDSLSVGDRFTDVVLYHSTSYDKMMNYRYGVNARVFFSTSTDTIEDAIPIRRGWANGIKSVEVDTISVPINDNDVLLNTQGDDDNFVPFPEVGGIVKDSMICATRRINKNHLLYDFQKSNMREIMDTDTDYYSSKYAQVYDINVYYNGDDQFPDNLFNRQLKRYYDDGNAYADAILHWCDVVKKSGSNYSKNFNYYKKKYQHWSDPTYKWVDREKPFNHIVVEFKVKAVMGLEYGSKITGRLKIARRP